MREVRRKEEETEGVGERGLVRDNRENSKGSVKEGNFV